MTAATAIPESAREAPEAAAETLPGAPSARLALRARLALYAAASLLLFLLERLIPSPLPWVRLGLANIVTLIVLQEEGVRPAAAVLGLRLLLGGFFAGSLFGPQFALSVCGGGASLVVMAAASRGAGRFLSPFGISLLGSATHAVAQLVVVGTLFAGRAEILALLPLFLALALCTGALTGIVADVLLARLALARGPRGAAPRP